MPVESQSSGRCWISHELRPGDSVPEMVRLGTRGFASLANLLLIVAVIRIRDSKMSFAPARRRFRGRLRSTVLKQTVPADLRHRFCSERLTTIRRRSARGTDRSPLAQSTTFRSELCGTQLQLGSTRPGPTRPASRR